VTVPEGFAVLPEAPAAAGIATSVLVHLEFEARSRARHALSLLDARGDPPSLPAVLQTAGLAACEPSVLRQVHGSSVLVLGARPGEPCPAPARAGGEECRARRTADAHVTADPSVALVICSADCVPVLVADPGTGAVGAAHAGWRGTADEIAMRLIESLSRAFGGAPSRLVALLGPAIGPCCYEVRLDVASVFRSRFRAREGFIRETPGERRHSLDLVEANAWQLTQAGLRPENILRSGLCTCCRRDLFPSYRAAGAGAGRLTSVISPRVGLGTLLGGRG